VTTAEAISVMVSTAILILGMVMRGVKRVVKAIRDLLTELKSNTDAVKDIGSTLDDNIKSVHQTLQNHETRITVLEGK
jgi:hypothetical protein